MFSRRAFIKVNSVAGIGFILSPWGWKVNHAIAQSESRLNAATHPKFVNPLPIPARIDATKGGNFNINMRETTQSLGLVDADGNPLMTTVWGYGQGTVTYPGPTFVAHRDVPVEVQWMNKLKEEPPGEAHLLPVDTSIHIATPKKMPKQGVPTVTHLHGGHTESASDGLPEAWFTRNFKETGPTFVKKRYRYDNDQQAATLWYHDHALGVTRLNVYAGLAGFYLLRDDNENQLITDGILPSGPYEIEMVIQDRMFTEDGQLFLPTTDPELPPEAPNPSIIAEFFGDFILVNGAAWPVLDVEPRKYRFRLLNGSDSRFYILKFDNVQSFFQIGTDSGLLAKPVTLTKLVMAPGERADLVVDFSDSGQELILQNIGPDEPFKGRRVGKAADPETTGQVMKFRVNQPLAEAPEASVRKKTQLNVIDRFDVENIPRRQLVLFEGEDQFDRLRPQLGTLVDGSLLWDEEITEKPRLNDVEVWEVYNATEDAHPIHLHLVAFQLLNREAFSGDVEVVGIDPIEGGTKQVLEDVVPSGDVRPPAANEAGWKDTVQMLPGDITRVVAKFDRPGRYVWHCHILSHEDHEMMRPYEVI
jgi:spore coat protein A